MDSNEVESLAQQLYAIYWEAIGKMRWEWDKLDPAEREAWIQVSQFIDVGFVFRDEPDHR